GVEQRTEIGSDVWWIAAAILTGIFAFAFGMFAVLVAIPKMTHQRLDGVAERPAIRKETSVSRHPTVARYEAG
ncbi:hypothetical protein C2W62_14170, partial [Candidatus Entotheonella serta]